jgi:hypothetical protein
MKAKANSIPQQVKDTELAALITKWLARTRSPIAFKRFVTAVRLEVRMPQLTEDMVRVKIGSNVVDIWRQVVRDHLQPRWCQVMENVIVGSEYDVNRGGQTRPGAVAHVSTSSTPLFGGSTSYLQERTVESGTGVASGCMDLDEDQSSDEEGRSRPMITTTTRMAHDNTEPSPPHSAKYSDPTYRRTLIILSTPCILGRIR